MKIINKEDFYELPCGILYSDYSDYGFLSLNIKQQTVFSDNKPISFFYDVLLGNIEHNNSDELIDMLDLAQLDGSSIKMNFNYTTRDSLFQNKQFFAVYEKQDLEDFFIKLESLRSNYIENI